MKTSADYAAKNLMNWMNWMNCRNISGVSIDDLLSVEDRINVIIRYPVIAYRNSKKVRNPKLV
jgi:hypothetical protein